MLAAGEGCLLQYSQGPLSISQLILDVVYELQLQLCLGCAWLNRGQIPDFIFESLDKPFRSFIF